MRAARRHTVSKRDRVTQLERERTELPTVGACPAPLRPGEATVDRAEGEQDRVR
jgi:hypothetical protein